jgi:tRNA(Ile)-lysidine synthase
MRRITRTSQPNPMRIDTTLLKPGLRLAVGVSGGADSVALLRALAARSAELGLVLHVAHLHHGLRGAEADADLAFVQAMAEELSLTFHEKRVDTAREASENAETLEEAARRLRYAWFRQLMAEGALDAVATAHTLDDQAETVLGRFLRGAWTEGLGGIHPVVEFPEGRILRPLLGSRRSEVLGYLRGLGQLWREDLSNLDTGFTRNRLRHEILPLLEGLNPRLRDHLAQMSVLARDEEAWWQTELGKLAPQIVLSGRPVRGGGRAAAEGIAIDAPRLAALAPAMQRRLVRFAAEQFGVSLDFFATEELRALALSGRAGQRLELPRGLRAERTAREVRIGVEPATASAKEKGSPPEYSVPIPGELVAPAFGLHLRVDAAPERPKPAGKASAEAESIAPERRYGLLRNWKAGDRVQLRHSLRPRKVKEVLERLRVTGSARAIWPVLEISGEIVWMKGAELEPNQAIVVDATFLNLGAGRS